MFTVPLRLLLALLIPLLLLSCGGGGGGGDGAPTSAERRPFPQHTPYVTGSILPTAPSRDTLDRVVRDFYDRWKRLYLRDDCSVAGERRVYVWFAPQEWDDRQPPTIAVSEGQGYGMMIVPLMAGHDPDARAIFDGLYRFYKAHPSALDPRLMAWRQVEGCGDETPGATDAATDGDLDIAFGLLLADAQWGSDGEVDYRGEATAIIDAIMAREINRETFAPLLGDWAADDGDYFYGTRSSDFIPDHFRAFGAATGDPRWGRVAETVYGIVATLQRNDSPVTGLLPDFIVHTGAATAGVKGLYLETALDGAYGYNACRVPWRLATDYLVSGDARAQGAVGRMGDWVRQATGGDPSRIRSGYYLDGRPIPDSETLSEDFLAPLAVGAMVDPTGQVWLDALWGTLATFPVAERHYYENTLHLLALIVLSGNWWTP
ncbi:MAG: beta-glucanase [Nitrospinae bacterium]|nr:beta-glucanase [Nitrospinota bacterium]